MADLQFKARPAAEAVDYFQQKSVGGRLSFDWRDVWQEEHLNSFVVAKVATRDVLADIFDGLVKAQAEGQSREQFVQQLTPLLQRKGWWGKQAVADPTTGEVVNAQLGSPNRLRTIFDINMRMANAAGRWERFSRSADSIFLRYNHTRQERPRPLHRSWDGITLPMSHRFWLTHFCPNGWRCKCYITSVPRSSAEATSEDELQGLGVDDQVEWKNRRTGVTEMVPKGVDPGFGYNVGQARLQGLQAAPMGQPSPGPALGPRNPVSLPASPDPRPLPADVKVRPDLATADAQAVFQAFSKGLGTGDAGVFTDKAQVPVVVGDRLFEGGAADAGGQAQYAELLAATLKDPDEIWHGFQARDDGSAMLVRSYVAAYAGVEGLSQWFVATWHEVSGVDGRTAWWGVAPIGEPTAGGARAGVLVYQRK